MLKSNLLYLVCIDLAALVWGSPEDALASLGFTVLMVPLLIWLGLREDEMRRGWRRYALYERGLMQVVCPLCRSTDVDNAGAEDSEGRWLAWCLRCTNVWSPR